MYDIPKISVAVELILMSGEVLKGTMFITEDLVSAEGNPQVEEFLNQEPDLFFPFQLEGGGYRLINKEHLMMVRSEQDDSEIRHQTPLAPRNLVTHFTNGESFSGVVYPTLVEESRVSDIINQEDDYLVVYEDSRKRIINRNHVVYVDES